MEGWIKLHRKLMEWEWFDNSEMVHLLIYFLLKANHKANMWRGVEVLPGQFITTLPDIKKDTGISVQSVRTCLDRLKSTGVITDRSTNKFRVITICKYDSYQDSNNEINSQINMQNNIQLTDKQQTTNRHNKNEKNNILPLTPTYTCAHEAEVEVDLNVCLDALLNERVWLEQFCMNKHLTPQRFVVHLKSFFAELQNRGETSKSIKDAKFHFSNWFKTNKLNETDRKLSKADKTRNIIADIANNAEESPDNLPDDEVLNFL